MDQSEPDIRHLSVQRVLQCGEDPDTGVRFLDLQTARGILRLHCHDDIWHILLKTLEDYEGQESCTDEATNVPSILRFLSPIHKRPTV